MNKGMELVINSYLRLMGVSEKHNITENSFMITDGVNTLAVMENPNHISYNGSTVYSEGENI